jgi:hypothetical protein
VRAEYLNERGNEIGRQPEPVAQRLHLGPGTAAGRCARHEGIRGVRRNPVMQADVMSHGGKSTANETLARIKRVVEVEDEAAT